MKNKVTQTKSNTILKTILRITALVLIVLFTLIKPDKADLVAFSYNRPLQLYALLESVNLYVTGLGETHVIYRSTDEHYEQAYQEVVRAFPNVIFHKQGDNPHADFKPLTIKASLGSPSRYIIFAVDDIIVKDFVDVKSDIQLLKQTGAYGFYYRLGLNINWCYMLNSPGSVSNIKQIGDSVYAWCFRNGQGDWGYPNTVDMTMYKKEDIEFNLKTMTYHAPNPLEGNWASRMGNVMNKIGVCHAESKIVNIPLNVVQDTYRNRNMNAFTPQELLNVFNSDLKIDISKLHKIKNVSPHIDYMPEFIKRSGVNK